MRFIGSPGELLCQDSIEEIIYRLQNFILGEKGREQNELVLYKEDGAIVPYETKKRKPRPKVDLDDETTRIWNLLMGKGEVDEARIRKKRSGGKRKEEFSEGGLIHSLPVCISFKVRRRTHNTLKFIFIHIQCLDRKRRHQLKLYPEIIII